jgi:hypothetical protein
MAEVDRLTQCCERVLLPLAKGKIPHERLEGAEVNETQVCHFVIAVLPAAFTPQEGQAPKKRAGLPEDKTRPVQQTMRLQVLPIECGLPQDTDRGVVGMPHDQHLARFGATLLIPKVIAQAIAEFTTMPSAFFPIWKEGWGGGASRNEDEEATVGLKIGVEVAADGQLELPTGGSPASRHEGTTSRIKLRLLQWVDPREHGLSINQGRRTKQQLGKSAAGIEPFGPYAPIGGLSTLAICDTHYA